MQLWRKLASSGKDRDQPHRRPTRTRDFLEGEYPLQDEVEDADSTSKHLQLSATEPNGFNTYISEDETNQDSGQYGMFILADKAEGETAVVDIIAIHGLNGHYRRTWTAVSKSGREYNWLQDFLPKQTPNARIMSYGYNSAVQFSKLTADIGAFADVLLEDIISWRGTEAEKARPIIFICHSLGGIVFKRVRLDASPSC